MLKSSDLYLCLNGCSFALFRLRSIDSPCKQKSRGRLVLTMEMPSWIVGASRASVYVESFSFGTLGRVPHS